MKRGYLEWTDLKHHEIHLKKRDKSGFGFQTPAYRSGDHGLELAFGHEHAVKYNIIKLETRATGKYLIFWR